MVHCAVKANLSRRPRYGLTVLVRKKKRVSWRGSSHCSLNSPLCGSVCGGWGRMGIWGRLLVWLVVGFGLFELGRAIGCEVDLACLFCVFGC